MRAFNLVLLYLWLLAPSVWADWYPLTVEADGVVVQYSPLARARQPWRICVLLPHGKDRYWWGVAWGLDGEGQRQGVRLGIYEAGSYEQTRMQLAQLQNCRGMQADAYVIAAIDTSSLCPEVQRLLEDGKPVIDLVNGLECPGLTAHSRVDFAQMSREALAYIEGHREAGPYTLGWLPGPEGAGWVKNAERGLEQALRGRDVRVLHGGYGPVERSAQAGLVRALLAREPQAFIIANTEAASFAAHLLQGLPGPQHTQVLSLYANERILEQIHQGYILAAPNDSPVLQGRIAIDLAVRALEGREHPYEVGPLIEVIDRSNLPHVDLSTLMPPEGQWMIRRELPQ